jgi:hypothetical protein
MKGKANEIHTSQGKKKVEERGKVWGLCVIMYKLL